VNATLAPCWIELGASQTLHDVIRYADTLLLCTVEESVAASAAVSDDSDDDNDNYGADASWSDRRSR